MTNPCINILLACFNGEKFIAEQINSILNQTYTNWQLYIRDDGSSDNTLGIIKEFQEKSLRVHFIKDDLGNLGSVQNFNMLLQQNKNAKYIMFCDQDDVWLPSKINDTVNEMMALEKKFSENIPLLVHTNFTYVDSFLKPIDSKKNFQATKIEKPNLANVLCQNSVYGCTMMINKKLVDVTRIIPVEAENHDYWIALAASAFGKICYLNKRTILYRQHGSNASTQFNFNSFSKRFKRILIDKTNFTDIDSKVKMATVFKTTYYNRLSDNNKKAIDDFIALFKKKKLLFIIRNIKNGVRRQTLNQTLLFYLTVFFSKKKRA